MDERNCRIIQVIAEEKNITKAAERLYISQPALTYRLRLIEEEVGSVLFERTTRGVELTKSGKIVLEYANECYERHIELNKRIKRSSADYEILRVGVLDMYAHDEFRDILSSFKSKYKNINVFLRTGINNQIIEQLNMRNIDVGIIINLDKHIKNGKFLTNSKGRVIYHKPFEFSDLKNIPRILYTPKSPNILNVLEKWWNDNFDTPHNISIGVDDIDMLFQGVKNGMGWATIANVSPRYIEENISHKEMKLKNSSSVIYPLCALYNKTSYKSGIVKKFVNSLLQWYDKPLIK